MGAIRGLSVNEVPLPLPLGLKKTVQVVKVYFEETLMPIYYL
jgi:hypothetical protein